MELDDTWSIRMGQVVGLEHEVVTLRDDGPAGAFEQSVVVGGEDVGPGKIEQVHVEWRGFMLQVRYSVAQHLIEGGPAEGGFDLVRKRRNLEVPGGGPGWRPWRRVWRRSPS